MWSVFIYHHRLGIKVKGVWIEWEEYSQSHKECHSLIWHAFRITQESTKSPHKLEEKILIIQSSTEFMKQWSGKSSKEIETALGRVNSTLGKAWWRMGASVGLEGDTGWSVPISTSKTSGYYRPKVYCSWTAWANPLRGLTWGLSPRFCGGGSESWTPLMSDSHSKSECQHQCHSLMWSH